MNLYIFWKSPVLKALSFLSSNCISWEMHSIYYAHNSVADLPNPASRAFCMPVKCSILELHQQPKLVHFNSSTWSYTLVPTEYLLVMEGERAEDWVPGCCILVVRGFVSFLLTVSSNFYSYRWRKKKRKSIPLWSYCFWSNRVRSACRQKHGSFHSDPELARLQRASSSLCMKDSLKTSSFLLQGEFFKARGVCFLLGVYLQRWGVHRHFSVCTVESNRWLGGKGSPQPCSTVRSFPCSFFTYWCTKEIVPGTQKKPH